MRPDRAIVKKAIQDAGGNLTRAAGLLGCTRQTLYTWIYQHGLERHAGIRMDTRSRVDRVGRPYTRAERGRKETKSGVYSGPEGSPNLELVEQAAEVDLPVQATFKCRESLWKEMKIEAIRRGCTVATLAEVSFERTLAEEEQREKGMTHKNPKTARRERTEGEDGGGGERE